MENETKRSRQSEKNARKREKYRAIREYFDSKEKTGEMVSPEDLAEKFNTTLKTIEKVLGKTRLKRYQDFLEGKEPERKKRNILTPGKVDRLIKGRNRRILDMYKQGFTREEIATKENLTLDQLKEIYLSLGLKWYTPEEIQEMKRQKKNARRRAKRRAKREAAKREEAERKEAERKEAERKEAERKEAEEEREETVDIKNYRDLIEAMRKLINERNSREAILLGESFLKNPIRDGVKIVDDKQRAELFCQIEELKRIKKSFEKGSEGRSEDDGR